MADLENLWACTVTAAVNSPSPSTLTRPFRFFSRPLLAKDSSVSSEWPSAWSSAIRLRFTTEYSVRKMLVKPRLGRRRWSGIWPPSKPRIMCEPARERCPLCPRVEVLPIPDPIPRPTRFLPVFAFLGARKLERFFDIVSSLNAGPVLPTRFFGLLYDPHQVRHGLHHASDRSRIFPLYHLIEAGKAQALDHPLVLFRGGNRGPVVLQAHHRLSLLRSVCHLNIAPVPACRERQPLLRDRATAPTPRRGPC